MLKEQGIFPSQEQDIPPKIPRKTVGMRIFEEKSGIELRGFLGRAFIEEGFNDHEIANFICELTDGKVFLTAGGVRWWRRCLRVVLDPLALRTQESQNTKKRWQIPGFREQSREEMRRSWQLHREARIAKIHSPEAARKRKETLQRRLVKLKAVEGESFGLIRHLKKVLGEDPCVALVRMHHEEGLPVDEIAQKVGRDRSTVFHWMKKLGIEKRRTEVRRRPRRSEKIKKIENLVKEASGKGLLEELKPAERFVLEKRYLQSPGCTQEKVADELQISRQRVNQIEKKALRGLRFSAEG